MVANVVAPVVPGLEVSGTVREVRSDVTDLDVGAPVCAFTIAGGYADVAVAGALSTRRLPDGNDATLRRGAALPTVVPTAWALVNEVARLRPDEDVPRRRAGGRHRHHRRPVRPPGRRAPGLRHRRHAREGAYAKEFGYDEVFVEGDWRTGLDAATGVRGVDVVLDSVGERVRVVRSAPLCPGFVRHPKRLDAVTGCRPPADAVVVGR